MRRFGFLIAGAACLISQSAMAQGADAPRALNNVWQPLGVRLSQPAVGPSQSTSNPTGGMAAAVASPTSGLAAAAAPGDGVYGKGDPSDQNDPTALTGVWRSYSAVDPSIYPANVIVSTNIAYSSDKGITFGSPIVLNPGSDLSTSGWTWNNEVPSLVYDSADPNPNAKWKVIWSHVVAINGNVANNIAWFGMRSANVPNGTWSSEVKLIAGNAYDPNNSQSPGPTMYPLPSALSDCTILGEPGTLTASNGFYMSLSCFPASGPPRTPLVKFTTSGTGNPVLSVSGTLLNSSTDASRFASRYGSQYPELRTTIAFTQPDLVKAANGTTYLIVSPVGWNATWGLHDMGCAVFQVTNLATASILRTSNGTPSLVKYVQGQANNPRGACTYASQETGASSTGSGINFAEVASTNPLLIRIVESGVPLP